MCIEDISRGTRCCWLYNCLLLVDVYLFWQIANQPNPSPPPVPHQTPAISTICSYLPYCICKLHEKFLPSMPCSKDNYICSPYAPLNSVLTSAFDQSPFCVSAFSRTSHRSCQQATKAMVPCPQFPLHWLNSGHLNALCLGALGRVALH